MIAMPVKTEQGLAILFQFPTGAATEGWVGGDRVVLQVNILLGDSNEVSCSKIVSVFALRHWVVYRGSPEGGVANTAL